MQYHLKPRRRAAVLGASALALLAATPVTAETLTVAIPTFSEQTMTPWAGSGQRKTYLDLVYDYLVYIDAEGNAEPGLATSWEMENEGQTWTFKLREGVPFSDESCGTVTAEDVKYSLERLIGEDSRAGPASTMRRVIDRAEVIDELTVRVHLKAPDFLLATGYFGEAQQLGIVCKSYIEAQGEGADAAMPVGTGPYTVAESIDGSEITLSLREDVDHWRVSPDFDEITFRAVPEEATRVAMLQAGEADIAPVSFDSIPGLENAGLRIVSAEKTWSPVIRLGGTVQTDPDRFNPDNPWADVRVRQALNYAVDKQTIIDELFHGQGTIANADTPVAAWNSVPPYPYDPEKARELLAEAGYPDGFEMRLKTFTTTPGAELPLMAEAVALYWADVGIDVTIEPGDWPSIRSEWTSGKPLDFAMTHRGFPFANPENGVEAGFSTKSLFASFTSDELETKLAELGAETDPAKRTERLTDIGHYIRDQAGAVFMVLANEPYGVGSRVGDWGIDTSYVYNFDQAELASE
ncbi:peptide/nickel transport system substrate-binding protein [Pseudooceanicola antarcticus]|uniref:ABC transporter substrate-binding protein n=1 Tax=Pseudooceanicola antarcticus TaxID=1247613 RepID=A0A285JIM4_9RHOB|nr:ABC transporter substrate-binding protein [Pseudooceanicola antarcticus]PJE26367.1 ABC transporter substrate-binding protein [Pseudooceanicola antarcticus]SNY59226.1 peptide/nickel transport system substrate-binding protein [Pseudooceanicola antarcticus]